MAIFYHQVVFWVSRSGAEWLSIMFVGGDFIEEHWGRIGCRAHTHTHTRLMCVWRGVVYDGWCWGWRWSDYIEFAGIWVSLWLTSRALSRTLHPVLKKWKQLNCRCYIQVQPSTHRTCQTLQIAFSPSTAAYFSQQFSRGMKKHSQDYLQATSIL